jgi:RimJ/RimL family protein N-acetyltransferase
MALPLHTPRLMLRAFALTDGDDLYAMDGDDRVMRYIGTGLPGRTREEVAAVLVRMVDHAAAAPGYGLLHGSRRHDGRFVGGCGLFPIPDGEGIELAYRLPHAQWGQGYATEMAAAVLAHGFESLGLDRINGLTYPENRPSQRVLQKIGMRHDGTAHHYGHEMHVYVARRPVRTP